MKIYICSIIEFANLPDMDLISEKRRNQIRRFLRWEDKERCLVAGLLLRYALGDKCDKIQISSCGKPYLADNSIYFNLSHSGKYVVLVTDSANVGVDIEEHAPIEDSVAERVYTNEEFKWLKMQNCEDAFYRLWTGKESIMKAVGLGFSMLPESFSVMPPENGLHIIDDMSWYMNWYKLQNYSLCISSENDIRTEPVFLTNADLEYKLKHE